MKTAYMALLIGVLMLSPSEAREEFMSKRASALMSALNVEAASDEIFHLVMVTINGAKAHEDGQPYGEALAKGRRQR